MFKNKILYFVYRILANVTFGEVRKICLAKKSEYNNTSIINVKGDNNIFDKQKIIENNISLMFEGNNNEIKFDFSKIKGMSKKLRIKIFGDNNKIEIGDNFAIHTLLCINLAYPPHKTNGSVVKIGDSFSVVKTRLLLLENNSKFIVGNNCLFSEDIDVRLSDTHSVLDLQGNLLNYGGCVEIGDHVWCGREVRILKNAKIADGLIIGASSVVTKCFDEPNIAIGGNPAKIIKRGVKWVGDSPQEYLDKNLKNKKLF